MSHYVYRNWQAAEFSKLHLYVIYIWLIVFILTSFILQLGSYLTSGVGRLLHLPSAEAVSARSNAHPQM